MRLGLQALGIGTGAQRPVIDTMLEEFHSVHRHHWYPHTVTLAERAVVRDVDALDVEREVLTHFF